MTRYILDTDHASIYQRGHLAVIHRIAALATDTLAVTIVTVEELQRGWFSAIRRAEKGERLVWAYAGLKAALDFLFDIRIIGFDEVALAHYDHLRAQKIQVGTQDLRIAAVVLSVGGILVTRNQRDFEQVPGLQIEDWTRS